MPCRVWSVVAFIGLAVTPLADGWAQAYSNPRCADTLASGGVVSGAALRRLTIDDPRQAFVAIPGVLFRSGELGVSTAPDVSIRGGAPGRPGTYVDGAPVRFQTVGTQGIGIAENAIEDVCLTTGVAPAIVADVAGGVVNYVTRTGGERLTGQVRWESDDPFGKGVSVGYNRIEASAGGPLPIGPNVSFFLSATLQGQLSRYRTADAASVPSYVPFGVDTVVDDAGPTGESVTVPRFVQWSGACAAGTNAGVECQGLRRPLDWSTTRRLQGKVQRTYGVGGASLMSVTVLGSDFQQRTFPGQTIMDPSLYNGGRARSTIAIANWQHQLGAVRGGPLRLDVNLSYGSDDQISGPLSAASEPATRDPYLGIEMRTLEFTGTDVFPLPVTDRLVRHVRTNSGLRVPYQNRIDLANRQPYRLNPFGVLTSTAWPSQGLNGVLSYVRERRLQFRGSLDWRPGTMHHVTAGFDAEHTNLSKYQSTMIAQAQYEALLESPARVGVFAGDRVTAGAAILDVGLRLDRITPGGEFATTPGRIFTNPNWFPAADTNDLLYRSSVARVFTASRAQTMVSPRLRLSYAISGNTSVRLGYGRSIEAPAWATFFQNANADLDFTNTSALFGRDVRFGMSSQVEVGVRTVGRDVLIDVAGYVKTFPQYVGRFTPFPDPLNVGDTINLDVLTLDEVKGFGLDARIEGHVGDWLSGSGAYSLLRAPSGANGVTTQAVAALATLRAPNDGPTFTRDLTAQLSLRATSGIAYDPRLNFGFGTITPSSPLNIATGSARLPWTKRVDVRVTKGVRAGGRAWTVYADVRNLFNFRNTRAVFDETGGVVNTLHRTQALAPEYGNLIAEASGSGALEPDGTTLNLSACASWVTPVNCVVLTRVERRFGDGNGLYTLAEQQKALNTYYDAFDGPWFFYNPGRTLRLGVEVAL